MPQKNLLSNIFKDDIDFIIFTMYVVLAIQAITIYFSVLVSLVSLHCDSVDQSKLLRKVFRIEIIYP